MSRLLVVCVVTLLLGACVLGPGGDLAYIEQVIAKMVADPELIDLTDHPREARELGAVVDLDSTGRLYSLGNLIECIPEADVLRVETRIVIFNPQTRRLTPQQALRLVGGLKPRKSFFNVEYVTLDFDDAVRATINELKLLEAVRDEIYRLSTACLDTVYEGGFILTGYVELTNVVLGFFDARDEGLCALCDDGPLFEIVSDSGVDIRKYRWDESKIRLSRVGVFATRSDFSAFGSRSSDFENFVDKLRSYDDINDQNRGFWSKFFSRD